MERKKIWGQVAKVGIPLLTGGGLLWYVYRDVDAGAMWEDIRSGVRYPIIGLSLLFGLAANIVRGMRWCLLLDQLGGTYRKANAIHAVLGNYTVNLLFPRVGELWRCGVVSRYDKLPFTKLFGTLLVDRVSDMLTVAGLALVVLLFNIPFLKAFLLANPALFEGGEEVARGSRSLWVWLFAGVGVAGLCFMLRYMRHFAFVEKLRELLGNVWTGMRSVWTMPRKRLFVVYTGLLWGLYFLYFYLTFFAFGYMEGLGLRAGLLAFVMGSIAVAVPVQAGIGAWHFAVISTLVYLDIRETDAAAFALVVHTVQTVWTGLCGLLSIALLPLLNGSRKAAVEEEVKK